MPVSSKLIAAFDFSLEDLKLNQQGIISDHQKKILSNHRKIRTFGLVLNGLMVVGMLILLCIYAIVVLRQPSTPDALIIGFVIIVGLILVTAWWWGKKSSSDLYQGVLSSVSGIAYLSIKKIRYRLGSEPLLQYRLAINSITFLLPTEEQFKSFEEGKYYTIYYIQDRPVNIIISITEEN